MDLWLQCVLSALAIWRLTHLLCIEEGPWLVFLRLRRSAGEGFWGQLLNCFYCLTVWMAAPFALALAATWVQRIIAWWALSGAAILLERATSNPLEVRVEE